MHLSLSVSPIYDADGRLIGASKISCDIIAAKRAELALKESEAWVARAERRIAACVALERYGADARDGGA